MTPLEERVVQAAKEAIEMIKPGLPEIVKTAKVNTIRFCYECFGVYDPMDYLIQENRWIVYYSVGKGEGTFVNINGVGYYDSIEQRCIELPND